MKRTLSSVDMSRHEYIDKHVGNGAYVLHVTGARPGMNLTVNPRAAYIKSVGPPKLGRPVEKGMRVCLPTSGCCPAISRPSRWRLRHRTMLLPR